MISFGDGISLVHFQDNDDYIGDEDQADHHQRRHEESDILKKDQGKDEPCC